MIDFYTNSYYREDLQQAIDSSLCFKDIYGTDILITGATGLIGSFLVDVLMYANQYFGAQINVYALGRSMDRLCQRFPSFLGSSFFHPIEHDINDPIHVRFSVDFIIHAASNAYPAVFHTDPVGTILGNIAGTYHLLEYARVIQAKRVLFVSSGEVYGQNAKDVLCETDYGYLDPTDPRSCYPSAKRTAENLCVSFSKQYGLETVIARPCHIYGPNAVAGDNRVYAQFINRAVHGEDIVLKSPGLQVRSYCYIADSVSALLTILLNGKKGEAYNISHSGVRISIAGLASVIADAVQGRIVYEYPDAIELKQRTFIERAVLASDKLEALGWRGHYDIHAGILQTIRILTNRK